MKRRHLQIEHSIQKHVPDLAHYALRLTRDRAKAEDLTQDSLVKALSRIDQFRSGTNLRAWLFTILRNTYLDDRRMKIRRGVEQPFEDWLREIRTPASQEKYIQLTEVGRKIRSLRRCDREILYLHAIHGLKYEDIAGRMGIPLGTVKSRLARARQTISV